MDTSELVTTFTKARRGDIKTNVFAVLREAYDVASSDGEPVSQRDLHYALREVYGSRLSRVLERDSKGAYNYFFIATLLPDYRHEVDPLPLVFSSARGHIYEPHTRKVYELGGPVPHEVPLNQYDKVLYVEKEGWWAPVRNSGVTERYDMAVVTSKGYSTEAQRLLLAQLGNGRNYQILVLHDADRDGYPIARTLGEATKRMRHHHVDVVDIGLRYDEALKLGLRAEEFEAKTNSISADVAAALTPTEREAFLTPPRLRIELNAIDRPDRAAFVDRALRDAGIHEKLIPPDDVLAAEARNRLRWAIQEIINERLDMETIVTTITNELLDGVTGDTAALRQRIKQAFARRPERSWALALGNIVVGELDDDDVGERLRELLSETLN